MIKRVRRIVAVVLVVPIIAVILFTGGTYGLLQTDGGRTFLVDQIEAAVSSADGLVLDIDKLEGNVFGDFQITEIILKDREGVWLDVRNIEISWSPFALLSGTARVNDISAQTVHIYRQPNLPVPSESEGSGIDFSLPLRLSLARIFVDQINLEEAVLGRQGTLRVSLNLNSKTDTSLRSELKITPLDGQGGFVVGEISYSLETTWLGVTAELEGPEGGLISRVLGLPEYPAVAATIVGDGPLNDWQGQVTANVEGLISGDLLVLTQGDNKLAIEISGGAHISQKMAAEIPLMDTQRIAINANLMLDPTEDDLTVSAAVIENEAYKTTLSGSIDLETLKMTATVGATVKQIDVINNLIAPVTIGGVSATAHLSGDLSKAQVEARVQITESQLDLEDGAAPFNAKMINAKATTDLVLSNLKEIPFVGNVILSGLENLPAIAKDVVGPKIALNLDGFYSLGSGSVTLQSLSLLLEHAQIQAEGQIHPEGGPTQVVVQAAVGDLQKLSPATKGAANFKANLTSTNIAQNLLGRIDVNLAQLDLGDPKLKKILGSNLAFGADVSLVDDLLTVDGQVPLDTIYLTAQAQIPTTFETIAATVKAVLPKLDALSEFAGVSLQGGSEMSATFSGALTDPDAEGSVALTSVKVNEFELGDVDTQFTANTIASSLTGTIEGAFLAPLIDMQYGAVYDLSDPLNLKVGNLKITQQGNLVDGSLLIPLDGQAMSGTIEATISNFKSLSLVSEAPLAGNVFASVEFENSNGEQTVTLDLAGQALSMGSDLPGIETLELKLRADRALTRPKFDLTGYAGGVSNPNMRVKEARFEAFGTLEQAHFNFSAESGMALPFEISGEGGTVLTDTEIQLSLTKLEGFVSDKKIVLQLPLNAQKKGDELRVDPFVVAVGGGQLKGDASILAKQVNVNLALQAIPLDLLNLAIPDTPISGTMTAEVSLSINPEGSEGKLSAQLLNVALTSPDFQDIPALASQLTATLSDGKLHFDGAVTGLTATSIKASGNIPVAVTFEPLAVEISDQAPLEAVLDVKSNLDKLWPLLGLDQHLLAGNLAAKGTVAGTIGAPKIKGDVLLSDGRYEELKLGTIIEQLQFRASVQDEDKIALTASGVDGDRGTLNLKGMINLATFSEPGIDISAQLRQMAVLRQDALSVITDADLAIVGNAMTLSLKGGIRTQTVEVDIGGAVAPSVVDLPVTEINFPEGRGSEPTVTEKEASQSISLAIAIDLPRRVFIRGRGLDSEWEGKLVVTGTADEPIIAGELSPVRGQFTFSGKKFQLQKGSIRLLGKADVDPELSLSAIHEGKNVTAIVSIEGTASDPKISFSSPDSLPEDEVLSRVLFGKSAAKLSALEALQLAQAVAEVSGNLGGGGGVMGFARQTLGVDVLNAGVNDETGNAEVSAGKYINDNIYVGVSQGATAGSTAARVEIELTPNLSIESETDQTTNSSVGVFWKWDY